ncbi:MAG: sulfotransferase, partial [Gammaproteobacteria bacterium]|nr:sulfotransferase [Gammaproteobacteria bacterium]
SIEIYPCDLNLRAGLVSSLDEIGKYERSIIEAKQVANLDPDSYAPWSIVGRAHGNCGQYEEGLAAYDRALALAVGDKKESANIELLRGHFLKVLGRYDESISAYRQSVDLVDYNGAGWWGLADMKTHRFSSDDAARMQRLAENRAFKPEQRTQAAFALGKALEDDGQFADAFNWYRRANALRTDISFDPDVNRKGIDTLISTFDNSLLDSGVSTEDSGPTPVFIVGLPRSGSTLIEQILASHSQIEGTMELVNLPNIVRLMTIAGGKHKRPYPASVSGFSQPELAEYGRTYLDSTAIYRTDKPYFIDKLPTNFDKVGLIHMILPRAIIIDARRHPLDCGLSCYKQHFAGGHHFSYNLEHIGHYYNDYLRLMDHWDTVLPGKVQCVQYESMISKTEKTVRNLLDHCGVPFEDACLRFFENKRAVRTASSEQVRQPIYDKSVRYWKNFESELEPLSQALGEATLARFAAL